MNLLFALLFHAATALIQVGRVCVVYEYAQTPAPLKIPTTPAPTTTGGVAFRMFREVVFFESLFKSNLWIWVLGWMFHGALALVLLRHLRYFTEPVNFIIAFIQPFGMYAGFAMAAGLAGLWARRFLVERIRYISTPSDHLMLALLLGIAVTGLLMKFVMHTDIVAVKTFFLGLMVFEINPLPAHPGLYPHLGMVVLLMIIFPVSKLLHAPGLFFSPTRNQVRQPARNAPSGTGAAAGERHENH